MRGWGMLRGALETDFGDTRGRILLLLSFIYDARAVLWRAMPWAGGPGYSAMALETIDALLPLPPSPWSYPCWKMVSHAGRLERWRAAGLART